MRKWIAAAMVATMALVAGCSSTDSADDGPVTLTYGVWSQEETMQKLVDAFQAQNPNVKVKLQVNPWTDYWTKLQVGAQGGTAPDAFWMLGDRFQTYASNKQLLPLDDAIKQANIDLAVYPKPLVDLFTLDGKHYGLPKDFDTIGLWYNKQLFDAAGVKHPTADWTWAEVQAAAAKLTNKSAGVYGITAPLNRQEGFYNTIAQAGGSVISSDGKKSGYDDPKTQAGLQYWVDFVRKGHSPTLQQMADTEAVAQFENGKVAMYYGGSFYAQRFHENTALRSKVDVTVLPKGETRATVINGIQNVGYAKSKHPEQLRKFLLFLGGEEAAKIQAATGAVIPAYKDTQQAWVTSMPEFNLKAFLDEIPYGVVYPVSANTAVWNKFEEDSLAPAWEGKQSVPEAAGKLAREMNEALAKE
ncbi:sugar ABC transporter substrate-binding protein [Micromonospora arborensis]|uniref:Sugar ABC transporter substrate-binding protein n=1 Tax=Micromonospora arborensis TaxID=2116518 RepID=A0A318NU53_9ACTN|nr:sugar ABC transporter substrate-binding protein [Micromonospora arborensis]PYC64314.1 sugar ABC transporter substrate-binding protein [Micromonospora arborensis]